MGKRILLVFVMCCALACGLARPIRGPMPGGGREILQFSLLPLGKIEGDKIRVIAIVKNISPTDVYLSSNRDFDWFSGYGMTVSTGQYQARAAGRNMRNSILIFGPEGRACPLLGSTFLLRPGEEIRRVVELERPEEVRSSPLVEIGVSMDVPVFDSSLGCKEHPWVSGTAAVRL